MVIKTKNRQVRIAKMGEANDAILVNQKTGDFLGATAVISYKKVDTTQFVKLFTQNIKLAFDLTQAGQKALYVLLWAVQKEINTDEIALDPYTLEEFLECNEDLEMSLPTFYRGLRELTKAQIIANAQRQGRYFINPNFIFNGDRVVFSTVLERDSENEQKKKGKITQIEE